MYSFYKQRVIYTSVLIIIFGTCLILTSKTYASDKFPNSTGSRNSTSQNLSGRTVGGTQNTVASASEAGRMAAAATARATGRPQTYSVSRLSNGEYAATVREADTGSDGNNTSGTYTPTPTPTPTPTTPTCQQTSDLATLDILFVRAGTYTGTARPANALLVDQANFQAGVAYQPIVQIRNLNCNSTSAFNRTSTPKLALSVEKLLAAITPNQALANGRRGSPTPVSTLSGYHINQLPFGTAGGFPVRLQIDYGQNGSYEYTEFLNNQGPIVGIPLASIGQLPSSSRYSLNPVIIIEKLWAMLVPQEVLANGRRRATPPPPPPPTPTDLATIYVAFPVFTATQSGTHSITASADVTNTQAAGRGCTSMVAGASTGLPGFISRPSTPTVSPIDWGCINEVTPAGVRSEANNNLTETFTVARAQVLQVAVADVTVRVGGTLTTVPFTVSNQSTSTLPGYTYTIRINNSNVGAGNRTLTLAPNQSDSVSGPVTYTVPNSPITVPLQVCATSALLATTSCATARVIVTATECSDGINNDPTDDTVIDAADNGCWSDPGDSGTYDEDDDSEGGMIDLPPPTLRIWSDTTLIRFNGQATINYEITATYAITCTVSGAGINETINHTPGTTTGSELSSPLKNKQLFTLSCPGFTTATTRVIDSAESLTIEVVPQLQEV